MIRILFALNQNDGRLVAPCYSLILRRIPCCKEFYRLARQGVIKNYTGVSSPYEEPENAALAIPTDLLAVEESVEQLRAFILRAIGLTWRIIPV